MKTKLFKRIKQTSIYILAIILIANFLLPATYAQNDNSSDETDNSNILELNEKIKENKAKIRELTEEMEKYKKEIATHQAKAVSLENQTAILEGRIKKAELDLQTTQARIETVNLELEKLNLEIAEKETEINQQKEQLAELIKTIYKLDQKSYLEILMLNNSFSDFFNQLQYIDKIQENLKNSVDQVKKYKEEKEAQKSAAEFKKNELSDLKKSLEGQRAGLSEQKTDKENLLTETKSSEQKFQNLVTQLKQEQLQIDAEINRLESTVREKLLGRKDINLPGVVSLMWPVNPLRGISAYFHDPDYPYRHIFEHPAIDIRADQGTAIKAAESGYVARAKMPTSAAYSYIMIIHGNNLSTVYGHTSKIYVKEDDYVVKGQTIGAVGGIPGTPGSGNLTTGPHLHFEVRSNGIPVNALEYLP